MGREADIQIVRYFFSYLVNEIERLTKINDSLIGKTECNSFKLGAVVSIQMKLKEGLAKSRQEAKKESDIGTSTAIIKLDNADAEVADYYSSLNLKRGIKKASQVNINAFMKGQQAGSQISLHPALKD